MSLGKHLRTDVANGTDSTMTPDISHGGGSRIAYQDGRVEDQQLPVPNASTPIPGDERGNASERGRLWPLGLVLIPRIAPQGRGQTHRGPAEARSEKLIRNTPVPYYAGRDSKVLNRRDHEGQGPDAWQPSETAPKRIFGGGRDGGDAHDLVQSGRSRGKPWCSGYAIVRIDHR